MIMLVSMGYFCTQKLQDRRSTLTKSTMSQKKDKLMKVLVVDMMSSEESDDENDDVITVRQIPWRTERVSTF